MPAKRRGPHHSTGHDLVAQFLQAHEGDVNALMRTLVVTGSSDDRSPRSRPRFTPRKRPKKPVTFRIRVDIVAARPPIWRRLDLAGDLTLDRVHRAIQCVFGWDDMHLHAFTPRVAGERDWTAPSFDNDGIDQPDSYLPEGEVRLDEVVSRVGDQLFYEYDFGDCWRHVLKVEEVRPRESGPVAVCVAARRGGPMEDCGGIWRYNEIVAGLEGRPTSLDEDELADATYWYGGEFDPAETGLEPPEDLDRAVSGAADPGLSRSPSWSDELGLPDDDDPAPASALVANQRLAPPFAELVLHAEDAELLHVLDELVAAAELDVTSNPIGAPRSAVFASLSREEATATTAPWQRLVHAIGFGGTQLLPDGTISRAEPADEGSLFTIGAANTADPVRSELISTALALRLLRKQGDRLLATRAGIDAVGDPIQLWRYLADRIAVGARTVNGPIGALALLVIATGQPARETFAEIATELAPRLGLGRPILGLTTDEAFASSAAVWTVVDACDGFAADGTATPPVRRLARAALLTS